MMAGNGSLRYGCHSRSINPSPSPLYRVSPSLTPLAGSRPATVPHSCSLSRSPPPFHTVCPLKTLLIAFWPHWPRRWRRWRWRRQRIADSGQGAACCMLHAACHWPGATVMASASATALATASKNFICRVAPAKCIAL